MEIFRNEKAIEEKNSQENLPKEISLESQITKFIDDLIYLGNNNPFGKKPYMDFRESAGKNRSPELDAMIKRHGYDLGVAYCLIGLQDILKCCERGFGIDFDLPTTGSTQSFWRDTKAEYKSDKPSPYSIGIYQKGSEWKGHAVLCLGPINNQEFSTFEFNTSPDAGAEIVRDGQGCYFKTRPLAGYGDMKLKGFVNIFKAIKQ